MTYIWATRGRTWGFRFLRTAETSSGSAANIGAATDPLLQYDEVFSNFDYEPEGYLRAGDKVALRYLDPLGRRDAAGRIIPHEFVVFAPLADLIGSLQAGKQVMWPLVEKEYSQIWDKPAP